MTTETTKALYDIMGSNLDVTTITESDVRQEAAEWNEVLPSIPFSDAQIDLAVAGLRILQAEAKS